MNSITQNPIIISIIGFLIIHSFLIFFESLKIGHSQFDDLLKIRLKKFKDTLLLKDLLLLKQYEEEDEVYDIKSILRAYWGLNILRTIGFIPFLLFFIIAIIYFSRNIFIVDLPIDKVIDILFEFIFGIELVFILIKILLKVPNILIKLNEKYNKKSYGIILFSIYPFWKKDD